MSRLSAVEGVGLEEIARLINPVSLVGRVAVAGTYPADLAALVLACSIRATPERQERQVQGLEVELVGPLREALVVPVSLTQ